MLKNCTLLIFSVVIFHSAKKLTSSLTNVGGVVIATTGKLVDHIRKEELRARWLQFVICANLGGVIRCHYIQITFLQLLAYSILESYRWFTNIRDGEVCYSLLILCAGIVLNYVSAGVMEMIREFLADGVDEFFMMVSMNFAG